MPGKPKIMLVDDDTDLLFLLKKQLEHAGYETSVCVNGQGLLRDVIDEHISLVLLDISMGAVSGKDLCKQIRANKKTSEVKILMMSADVDIRQISTDCGADGFVTKPLDLAQFRNTLASLD